MRSGGGWVVFAVALVVSGLVVFSCGAWFIATGNASILSTSSPIELAPGEGFVAARGAVDAPSRLEFELRQWQGAPLRARVTNSAVGLLLSTETHNGALDSGCELPPGKFELRVENADTVARTVDVKARLAD